MSREWSQLVAVLALLAAVALATAALLAQKGVPLP